MFSFSFASAASAFLLILPWPLLATGILSGFGVADRHPLLMKRATTVSAGFALVAALMAIRTLGFRFPSSVSMHW